MTTDTGGALRKWRSLTDTANADGSLVLLLTLTQQTP